MMGNKNEAVSCPLSVRTFIIQSSHFITDTETINERVDIDKTGVLMIEVTDMTSF